MTDLHIRLLLSKWSLVLARHRSELEEIEREISEFAAKISLDYRSNVRPVNPDRPF